MDWVKLYIGVVAAVIATSSLVWCLSPRKFAAAYRAIAPRDRYARTPRWERAVMSRQGRICGGLISLGGLLVLYETFTH